jgi:hypothetical protein
MVIADRIKTFPFTELNLRSDNITQIVLTHMAIENPRFRGVCKVSADIPVYVYVEGHGVVSGIAVSSGLIIISCRSNNEG